MKKYILAAALALCAVVGPTVGSANAQGWFGRGGPTFVDRLVGNGYNNYGNYGGYGNYNGYNNFNYGNRWRGGCNNNGWGNGNGGWGNGNGGWGNGNGWGNFKHHHHHHHGW